MVVIDDIQFNITFHHVYMTVYVHIVSLTAKHCRPGIFVSTDFRVPLKGLVAVKGMGQNMTKHI